MKSALLKAKARKQKFNKRKEEVREEDDSDASMSDEEEELYSENMVGKLANGKYLIVKYLGKGSFSKVWLVLDMIIQKYYALKIQESKYNEDMDEELKILNQCSDYYYPRVNSFIQKIFNVNINKKSI